MTTRIGYCLNHRPSFCTSFGLCFACAVSTRFLCLVGGAFSLNGRGRGDVKQRRELMGTVSKVRPRLPQELSGKNKEVTRRKYSAYLVGCSTRLQKSMLPRPSAIHKHELIHFRQKGYTMGFHRHTS